MGAKIKSGPRMGKKMETTTCSGMSPPFQFIISTQDPSKMDEFCWQNMAKHPWIGRSQRVRFIFN
jgi:hypothetical protein